MDSKKIISLFIAFIMVASVFGIAVSYLSDTSQTSFEYNGFEFTQINGIYRAILDDKVYDFNFLPQNIEYIELSEEAKKLLASPVIGVTYSPDEEFAPLFAQAQYYFESQLEGKVVIDRALTNSTNTSLSQKSCTDATEQEPIIEFAQGNTTELRIEGFCIISQSVSPTDVVQHIERMMFQILGVMK